ncbi:hypothetical protein [Microbacterium sp. BK668]|uniref:hypothetical protein n=1 Tax=Microbacterium sp. BK668 TaxID=2512118 RepID=UPI0010601F5D|nr:hypothetical protein [Microbacterium sp. BK668]TDN88468.1 hypothetical protein EV279_2910 [Microbacterium sp. BK668]
MPPVDETTPRPGRGRVTKVSARELGLRTRAKALMLGNPNYFGTRPGTSFEAVEKISFSTTFEQLTCVGLNPTIDQLEAVVRVSQTAGYGGALCGAGSREYVRFFVSYDAGATWTDAGMDSFAVHDSAGARPLEFAVDVVAPLKHFWCLFARPVLVRAILSWNAAPTAGDPDFSPVWGNVVTVSVAPRTTKLPPWSEFLQHTDITLPPAVLAQIDPDATVTLKAAETLSVAELAQTYAGTDVEPHRFLAPAIFDEIGVETTRASIGLVPPAAPTAPGIAAGVAAATPSIPIPPPTPLPLPASSPIFQIPQLKDIDLGTIIATLLKTDGDTSYEELGCIGYDPAEDALIGILTVKKPNGYSGGPCTAGSVEHVAFWIDWGGGWSYVGTAGVVVHDEDVPDGGLRFAVYLPLASTAHRRDCAEGPVEPRVRAILSWATPPPPADPEWVPTWGNREEATIQLPVGALSPLRPVFDFVSGVSVCDVDQSDGRTAGGDNPFGGVVTISGFIPDAPDVAAPQMRYRVRVRPSGSALWTTLTTPFTVGGTRWIGTTFPQSYSQLQTPDADGFFPYLVDRNIAGAGYRTVYGDVLYPWDTTALTAGLWEIEVVAKDAFGTVYPAQILQCSDGTVRTTVTIRLDEKPPKVVLEITEVEHPDGSVHATGPCKRFTIGDKLRGTYAVTDEHLSQIWFELQPDSSALGALPTFSGPTAFPAVTTTAGGTWELDTSIMAACGYVLTLWAHDRTITPGGPWRDRVLFGFSLEA